MKMQPMVAQRCSPIKLGISWYLVLNLSLNNGKISQNVNLPMKLPMLCILNPIKRWDTIKNHLNWFINIGLFPVLLGRTGLSRRLMYMMGNNFQTKITLTQQTITYFLIVSRCCTM